MNTAQQLSALDVQQVLQSGDFDQAMNLAKKVLDNSPNDVYCLSILANSAFGKGNLDEAKSYLTKALEEQPEEINLNRNLGIIYNKQGEFKASVETFIRGIEGNLQHPEILLDVMMLGISVDKISPKLANRTINMVFNSSLALQNAYLNKDELPLICEASSIANNIVRNKRYDEQKAALDELSLGFPNDEKQRLYDFLDIFHGIKPPQYPDELQRPAYHAFPGLNPVPFYKPEDYDWTTILEEGYRDIKQEMQVLYDEKSHVKPYIEGMKTGVEGLDKLADSLDWSSIHLIKAGKCNQELLAKCPKTHAVLDKLPMPVLDGNAPEVFLSVLKPGAEIKPHYGLSNIKLTVHLGLEIPNDCAIRVGTETQSWENGKVLIFDDSFKHEAWNHSDSERKVLILELWHPDLTTLEKQGIQKIMELQHHSMQLAKNDTIESLLAEIKAKIA